MNIGPFVFGAPWALLALATLPALWWLLRATPPPPQLAAFPPTRLLLGLKTEETSRERAPWWLVLLRALMAALLILGFARPSLAPEAARTLTGAGRTLIVIDDGWTSAPFWSDIRTAAQAAAAEAERANAPVFILQTAPAALPSDPAEAMTGADARSRIGRLEPKPWRPDRAAAVTRLNQNDLKFDRVVWISDGLQDAGAEALAEALKARGPVTLHLPAQTARAIVAAGVTAEGVEVTMRRAANGAPIGAVAAETEDGRALGAAQMNFDAGALTAHGRVALPPEIAARAARVRVVGEQSAGAVRLLPAGAGRPFVGLVDPGGESQSLVSELYYVDRALSPYASLQRGTISQLIDQRAQALILPDASAISPLDKRALEQWLEDGGLLVRFAGPRLANEADDLLPVRLRPGSRTLGGALAWETAQAIAPFPDDSPFAGVTPPADAVVRQQVLGEPTSVEQAQVWARLTDNSPLVTARAKGHGLIVLFHTSAGPAWSDIPLSGVFVEMLRRTLAFSGRADGAGERAVAGGPYTPTLLLDGFGGLNQAAPDATPIPADQFALAQHGPATPPGLYERAGLSAAIHAGRDDEALTPLAAPAGVRRAGLAGHVDRPLAGWFLGAAAFLLALDLLISLFLIGRLPRLPKLPLRGSAAALLFGLMLFSPHAEAQPNSDPTQTLRLAYVRTGDASVDRTSQRGLQALSDVLTARTAVEPGPPMAVDLARDDLSPYPFLYWPAPSSPRQLSDEALANLDRYLAIGGLLFVDTRDAGRSANNARPAALMLRGLDAPPLEPVTEQHVVARSFYLMRGFPGRAMSTHLWAESGAAAQSRDGVAALFVGDGDWATAWASEGALAGGARQRELALRFGVNVVMVALTGNYKADQVHVPELLRRMGREGGQ